MHVRNPHIFFVTTICTIFLVSISGFTQDNDHLEIQNSKQKTYPEQTWGIAVGGRTAANIFDIGDGSVNSLVPLLFYEGERFYLAGIEGGFYFYSNNSWQASLLGRLRFFDIPEEYQNEYQGNTVDAGARLRYMINNDTHLDFEILSDQFANTHANIKIAHRFEQGDFEFTPYFNLRFTSSGFNDRYYALEWLGNEGIDGGADYQAGARVKYHLVSNLYLLGALSFRWLDSSVRHAEAVTSNWETEAFAGLGLFNENREKRRSDMGLKPYLRLSHGWATSSSLGNVLIGDIDSRDTHNQMTSLFYGYPLTDTLFGLPIDIYLTPGFAYHYSSRDQNSTQEYVVAIKAYYTIKLPIRLRFGVAEGFSYISEVTSLERKNTAAEGYEPSNLLNYLDLSLDINVGDLSHSDMFEDLWIGAALHHRSAIFESAQQFSGIAGGSNYPSLYLQYHF